MMAFILAIAAVLFLTGASVYDGGGKAEAPPPTDLEMEQDVVAVLQAQVKYLTGAQRRLEFEVRKYQNEAKQNLSKPDETEKWWADYAKTSPKPAEAKQ